MSRRASLQGSFWVTGFVGLFALWCAGGAQAANRVGFVWDDCPTCTGSHTPPSIYSYNSSGGSVSIDRLETGLYNIVFASLYDGAPDDLQATAYGTAGFCDGVFTAQSGTTLIARVACFDKSGNNADTHFTLLYQSRNKDLGTAAKGLAYLTDDQPTMASYTPTNQYNSTGASNTISRNSIGNYTATLPGLTAKGGDAQATALDPDTGPSRCKAQSWSATATGTTVNVLCFDETGAADDVPFDLDYALDVAFGRDVAATSVGAYALANKDTDTSVYTPIGTYNYNGFGTGRLTAQKTATGSYTVTIPGSPTYNYSTVLVTAFGSGSNYCNVHSWNFTTEQIFIDCYAQGGAAADTKFDVAFQTAD